MVRTLFGLIFVYFKIADKFNIIDKPNHRSAHTEITLRGGGIIYWFASFFYVIQNHLEYKLFFLGITIICLISFWDDIQSLSNKVRLVAHFLAITIVFYDLSLFKIFPVHIVFLAYIMFIGIINAYNFMDGINGITGLYSIAIFGSFWYVNNNIVLFIPNDFLIYPVIASLVFLFFNFRNKAICFAGDIGSIGIAFWIVFVLLKLMIKTNSIIWILFLAVYGVDSVCTIIHRLCLKENIFIAHRHHFYQILSNDYKIPHQTVSFIYFFVQLICSILVIKFYSLNQYFLLIIISIILICIYLTKFYLLEKLKLRNE